MSYGYYIINHTRKERVHFDNMIHRSAIETRPEITLAYMVYLMNCHNDNLKLFDDDGDYIDEYKDVNLSKTIDHLPIYQNND
jgi:hypothetical protein